MEHRPRVLSASTMMHDNVVNAQGESLGKIEEIMMDVNTGRVAYAVLSFGGVLGLGDKLFAIPWEALKLDAEHERFILNVDKETLKDAPGFNKDNWPETTSQDDTWLNQVYDYYDAEPYWRTPGSSRR